MDFFRSELLDHDTQFAPGYEHSKWIRIQNSMKQEEVLTLLGPPLRKDVSFIENKDLQIWEYTDSKEKIHYHVRQILFDQSGLVINRHEYFK